MPEAKLQFYYDKSAELTSIYNSKPLTFTVVNGVGKIWILDDNGYAIDAILTSFYVSFDGGTTWSNEFPIDGCLAALTQTNTSVMVQGVNETIEGMHFVFQPNNSTRNAKIKVSGNLLSLIVGPNEDYSRLPDSEDMPELPNGCFKKIFMTTNDYLPTNLIDASKLVLNAKDLPFECYASMFEGCTDLVTGPALTSTNLGEHCYDSMFKECSSLNYVPELPALSIPEGAYMRMFNGCTSMTKAPELPATQISKDCYWEMFSGCTSITYSPELPATTMYDNCYFGMFGGSGIFAMPDLKATELAESCYAEMFQGCTNLVVVTDLNAPVLKDYCYRSMFQGCTSIEHAPLLPATVLVTGCYEEMFKNCSNLNYIRALFIASPKVDDAYPYTTDWVYGVKGYEGPASGAPYGTFYQNPDADNDWDNLINANAIPIYWSVVRTVPEQRTYTVTVAANNSDWGTVSGGGTYNAGATCTISATAASGYLFSKWYVNDQVYYGSTVQFVVSKNTHCIAEFYYDDDDQSEYKSKNFTLVSLEDNNEVYIVATLGPNYYLSMNVGDTDYVKQFSTLQWRKNNTGLLNEVEDYISCTINYVKDEDNYTVPIIHYTNNIYKIPVTLNTNDTLEIRTQAEFASWHFVRSFGCTKDYKIEGNMKSFIEIGGILYPDDSPLLNEHVESLKTFNWSFTLPQNLPYRYLGNSSNYGDHYDFYSTTFTGRLINAYNVIFLIPPIKYCLIYRKYNNGMLGHHIGLFSGQNEMVYGPKNLPTMSLKSDAYAYMFNDCTSLVNAPALPATTLATNCYQYMFNDCTSLVNAPVLPATTLAYWCYANMFNDCTSLVNAPALPATTLKGHCYAEMFAGCTSLVNAPALPATTLAEYCYADMFSRCTSITTAPTLPAQKLVLACYDYMFQDCVALNSITVNAITSDGTDIYYATLNWVQNVAPDGEIWYKSKYNWSIGDSGLPTNWTKHAS